MFRLFCCTLLVVWIGTTTSWCRGAEAEQGVDFNRDIRPLLADRCLACHGRDEASRQGSLRLDDRESATGEADSGEVAIVAGAPDKSELMVRITSDDEGMRMPPLEAGAALTRSEIELLQGRYLRIELPGPSRILSLAEVEVFQDNVNLARAGTASQVSTDYEGPAELAIDGVTNGDFAAAKSTTHTRQQADPWWEVDLGQEVDVDRIVLWNRTDNGLQTRLAPLDVKLFDAARNIVWQQSLAEPPLPDRPLTPRVLTPLEKRRAEIETNIAQLQKTRPELPTLPVMEELEPDRQRATHVLVKGQFLTKGERVEPGVLSSFHALPDGAQPNRLGLARWLVADENPLTARVTANRLWARIFGTGLVATEEDFGTQGDPPSHPELLDWLAAELVLSGWDTKQMLRLIVTSATYRQSAAGAGRLWH